jgi:hypothetical protein
MTFQVVPFLFPILVVASTVAVELEEVAANIVAAAGFEAENIAVVEILMVQVLE